MRIERGESVDRACKRIVDETLREAARLAGDRALGADERVHEVRLCLKRARATLALVAGEVGAPARRDDRALRAIAHALGPLRDRAVARETLGSLAGMLGGRAAAALSPSSPLGRWLSRALDTADAEARLAEAGAALARVRGTVCRWKVSRGRRAAREGFEDAYRRARRAGRRARDAAAPVRFHAWRKAVKRLDTQVGLLERRAPAAHAAKAELKRLARVLGDLHDLAVLRDVLARGVRAARARPARATRAALLDLVDERDRGLRREADALGATLFAERPAAVGRRVRGTWVKK
jgi:CHAD domain-containing protein